MAGHQPAGRGTPTLWFNPPDDRQGARRPLTRERVAAEALAVIAAEGAQSLSMRALASRLGVVPGALYRHVHGKEELYAYLSEVQVDRLETANSDDFRAIVDRAVELAKHWR